MPPESRMIVLMRLICGSGDDLQVLRNKEAGLKKLMFYRAEVEAHRGESSTGGERDFGVVFFKCSENHRFELSWKTAL